MEFDLSLPERNWHPPNRARLDEHIARWRTRAETESLNAVFDFDNTTIFHDAGEAVMRFQLDRLAFRLDPHALAGLLPERVGEHEQGPSGVRFSDLRSDVLDAWTELWPLLERGAEAEAFGSAAHLDFRARMVAFYEALDDTPEIGSRFSYPWLACWLGGFTREEARALAVSACEVAKREPFGAGTWETATSGRTGKLRAAFETGLRAQPEMIDLFGALHDAGVKVYVITASQEQLVEGALDELGYPHDMVTVYGMRLQERDGRLQPHMLDQAEWPHTTREGKRALIQRELDTPPVLVAGDSDNDFEMLTGFEETEVRLVIERGYGGEIRSLDDDERTLLQGRDEPNGCFRPSRETVRIEGGWSRHD
jgi:hypothetical protein